jgi:intracellular sulfur oxidation DsrE/DsrF family protein
MIRVAAATALAAVALAVAPPAFAQASATSPTPAASPAKKLDCTSPQAQASRPKAVFQVNRAEDAPLVLRFVGNYLKAEPDAEVVVVGYASGIDFMLRDALDAEGKPYAALVNRLIDRGVAFKVCNNTLNARQAGPDVVIAGVGIVPSAVNEIVRLQTQEGYAYFRH